MTVLPLADIAPEWFLVPFGFALVGILGHVSRWGRARGARWLEGLFFFGLWSMFLLLIVRETTMTTQLWNGFMNRKDASELVFQSGHRTVTVTERGEIEVFFSLLRESRKVSAHHSGPLAKIQLTVSGDGYRYSIGPDSDHENEFWIDDVSCDSCDGGRTIAQVESRRLSEYLRELQLLEPFPES